MFNILIAPNEISNGKKIMAKILLVTDAWHPQTNGVVTTLDQLHRNAINHGDRITVIHPKRFRLRFPMPGYTEIDLAFPLPWSVRKHLKKQIWDHIHIATPEGPIGIMFARTCRKLNIPFFNKFAHTISGICESKISFGEFGLGLALDEVKVQRFNPHNDHNTEHG